MVRAHRVRLWIVCWQFLSVSFASAFQMRQHRIDTLSSRIRASRTPNVSNSDDLSAGRRRKATSWKCRPPKGKRPTPRESPLGTRTAEDVETQVSVALEALRKISQQVSAANGSFEMLLFPTVRVCNAALASFGDDGDLLRALRMFGKMRKAEALGNYLQKVTGTSFPVPSPTLVTYSTLMSRAVKLKKERVALRLLRLMGPDMPLDLKASNILMNCYAKLADTRQALKLFDEMNKQRQHQPNLVTFNTLLHACQKAGDLDAALKVKENLDRSRFRPDARTYTSLIATVARKRSKLAGTHDPSMAFTFLEEMQDRGIRPNGMTYSALIDACGRCGRSDLALQGLRIMFQQKTREQHQSGSLSLHYALPNEVGAWTAAIDACGKAGGWETALRLFHQMTNSGVTPNTITCGCLTDTLLRCGRTEETLTVLRYMKKHKILPSEVMYTSLMIHAETLIDAESKKVETLPSGRETVIFESKSDAKAIEVYTELILSLIGTDSSINSRRRKSNDAAQAEDSLLLKVFLVFQQMKDAGAHPDLACYNALMKACARAGDHERAQIVLQKIEEDHLFPNDKSWRELLRSAVTKANGNLALSIWQQGVNFRRRSRSVDEPDLKWQPSSTSFRALITAYLRQAEQEKDIVVRRDLYNQVVLLYEGVLMADESIGMDSLNPDELLEDARAMLAVLQAIVAADALLVDNEKRSHDLRGMAASILELECLADVDSIKLPRQYRAALLLAKQSR